MQTAAETRITEKPGRPPRSVHRLERRAAFTDLLGPNLGPLKRYVAAVLRYSADVDDIVQQTVLKAYVHLDQFRFEAQFGTWLRQIALNEIRQLRRQRSPLRTAEGIDRELPERRESLEVACERREAAHEVHRAIGHLSANYQTVVVLRYLDELDLPEIAERLSISPGAVKIRLHRARRQLAHHLSRAKTMDEIPAQQAQMTKEEHYGSSFDSTPLRG